MQKALDKHAWPSEERVRVRMGMHAGEAAETPTGLVGMDVHRAARIAAVAHGGHWPRPIRPSLLAKRRDQARSAPGVGDTPARSPGV
jgi:hypothetical protein